MNYEINSNKKKKILIIFSILLIATLAISMIGTVNAAEKTITPTSSGGLQKAVDRATDGDIIYLKKGVYKGKNNTEIFIDKNISIIGKDSKVVMDGKGKSFLISVHNDTKVFLKGIKFKNGYDIKYSGAAVYSKGFVTINSCTFTNNKALTGGALYSERKMTVINCTFKNNKAKLGGAIDAREKLTVINSTFINNQVPKKETFYEINYGGAIYCERELIVTSCTFNLNKAPYGGAIYSFGNSTLSNNTFNKNQAIKNGGAICNEKQPMKIVNSNFTNNIVGNEYKAIYYFFTKPIMKNVKITPKEKTKVENFWVSYLE